MIKIKTHCQPYFKNAVDNVFFIVYNNHIICYKDGANMKIQDITKIALLTALLSVSAYINIPLGFSPVGLTLQTLIINLTAILLSPSKGFFTILIYTLIGLVGVPVFSGGAGGPGKLFGPTGGYILGFMIAVPLMSFTKDFFFRFFNKIIKNESAAKTVGYSLNGIVVGMAATYVPVAIYTKLLLGKAWGATMAMFVVPFLPLDIVKCIMAAVIAIPVMRALNK